MVSALRALILALCVVAFAAPVCAQEIANWPAPPLWSPAAHPPSGDSRRVLSAEGIAATQAIYPALPFIPLTPCRIADTRGNGFTGAYGPPSLAGGSPRDFTLSNQCGINASAQAVSLNVTVVNTVGPGFLLIFPQGTPQPTVSTLNYLAGQTVANAAIVPLGVLGAITAIAGVSGFDLIIDTNGYYGSPAADFSNVFLGPAAGNSTMTGGQNTAIGSNVLTANTTGVFNTAIGDLALRSNTIGVFNTATGSAALRNNTSGGFNTAIGESALLSNTTGNDNIAIGASAGSTLTTGDTNIDIGNAGVSGESATIRIGSMPLQTRAFLAGVRGVTTDVADAIPVMIDSAGQLGTVSSSRRVKRDIEDMGDASQALMKLRPVTFRYKASLDPSASPQYGLIAEEVAEVLPDLVVYDNGGEPETVRYHVLVPMLLNEVQKDRKTIADLTARLERLEALMAESSR